MEIQLKNKLKMELNNVNSTSYKIAMDVTEAVIMVITNYFLFFFFCLGFGFFPLFLFPLGSFVFTQPSPIFLLTGHN